MTDSQLTLENGQSCFGFTIGINHYEKFQALSYAQEDAQAFQSVLLAKTKTGLTHDRHWLLTDTSPLFAEDSTRPTQHNIMHWLDRALAQLPTDSWLWFFFSGYGMTHGSQDYLMPIDADPNNIAETGIAVQQLFARFKANPHLHTVACLDINRSQSRQAETIVGAQAIELAKQWGISLFLACQVEEFSHESTALRQGFFTATLLSALRDPYCQTLTDLGRYLDLQLPRLNDHHLVPIQHPVSVVAAEMAEKSMFPTSSITLNGNAASLISPPLPLETVKPMMTFSSAWSASNGHDRHVTPSDLKQASGQTSGQTNGQNGVSYQERNYQKTLLVSQLADSKLSDSKTQLSTSMAAPTLGQVLGQAAPRATPIVDNGHNVNSFPAVQSIASNGANGHRSDLVPNSPNSIAMNVSDMKSGQPPQPDSESIQPTVDPLEDSKFWPKALIFGTITLVVLLLGVLVQNRSRLFMQPNRASNQLTKTPSSKQPEQPRQPGQPIKTPQSIQSLPSPEDPALRPGFQALQNNQPDRALTLLDQVPPAQQKTQAFTTLRQQAQYRANQAVLDKARSKIVDSQASKFSEAIKQAQAITPNDPLYTQAQQDIERWSQVILNLAEGRAMKGNYESAIAAAKLVPVSNSVTYQQSQQLLKDWTGKVQLKQRNQGILRQAKAKTMPWQASSYNQAISLASTIPQGQPFHAEARIQIKDWSQRIVTIARARAAERKLSQAIQTAQLVPKTTPAYATAQQDIANWSQQVFQIAKAESTKGQFRKAVLIANHIPSTAPIYGEARRAIANWQANQPAAN